MLIAQLVRWEEECNTWGSLVRSEDSRSDTECVGPEDSGTHRRLNSGALNQVYESQARKSGGKFLYIKKKTQALLGRFYCSPLSAIIEFNEFRKDNILIDPKNRDYVTASIADFGRDLNDMSLRDIYNMLTMENVSPKFFISFDYGKLEESIMIIDQLLNFQFDENEEAICHFLRSLVDIIDKKLSKTNGLVVKSPASGGKNFFFDMIFALLLNYGQLGQANKNNNFAFQEAPSKRILVWNEPNYCSSLTDTLKMMFAGDPFTVRVKHGQDTHVRRTPIIVLTNSTVQFMNDPTFKDRIIIFRWKTAEFLKNIEYKPHPMCLFEILNKYNIQF